MKYISYFLLLFATLTHAQVGINTETPHPAAALDISTEAGPGGVIFPRVTIAERDLIPADATSEGLMVFVVDGAIDCMQVWNTTSFSWNNIFCQTANQRPVASNVSISGTPVVGSTLTGNYTYSDADNDSEGTTSVEWITYDDVDGSNPITVSTSNQYTIEPGDLGRYIRFEVNPIATDGAVEGNRAFSNFVGPITNPVPFADLAQDFDSNTSWNYSVDPANFNISNDVWDVVNSLPNITNVSGNFWGMRDLNNGNGGRTGFLFLTLDPVNISTASNVRISFDYDAFEFDTSDDMTYELLYDGVSQGVNLFVDGVGDLSLSGTIIIDVPDGISSVQLIMGARQNGEGDTGAWDNFRIFEN